MFAKIRRHFRTQNEIMEKLLEKLANTNSWIKSDIVYRFDDSDLEIKWGWESGYDTGNYVYEIISPTYMKIPIRYRSEVKIYINKINHREGCRTNRLDFLNQYLSGEYCYSQSIKDGSLSEMTIWLTDEGIAEYNVINDKIWFKNESDAMAFKLRWT